MTTVGEGDAVHRSRPAEVDSGGQATSNRELPFSAAAERNQQPILQVLRRVLPAPSRVLEIASGTGQHAAHFAAAEPRWAWQPTDREADALLVIAARCAALPHVRAPLRLDVLETPWPAAIGEVDAVFNANMLHISPWATCPALMAGAARCLTAGGRLVLYGPFIVDGEATAPGNLAFDVDLRASDATWGIRRLADVVEQARAVGLQLRERIAMPANNLMLVFDGAR